MPTTILPDGTIELTSEATFTVNGAAPVAATITIPLLPSLPVTTANGRLVHPGFGAYDYEVKPDAWTNIDGDVIVKPIWAHTRTLGSAANVLWPGHVKDVMVHEHWLALGGLAMPIGMLRLLILMYVNPPDPDAGFVEWYPNYVSSQGFKVMITGLAVGDEENITLDDIINTQGENGPDGWVVEKVKLSMRIEDRI